MLCHFLLLNIHSVRIRIPSLFLAQAKYGTLVDSYGAEVLVNGAMSMSNKELKFCSTYIISEQRHYSNIANIFQILHD